MPSGARRSCRRCISTSGQAGCSLGYCLVFITLCPLMQLRWNVLLGAPALVASHSVAVGRAAVALAVLQ